MSTTGQKQSDDRFPWLIDLAISILIAAPYAIWLLGSIIRPTHTAWLAADPATHYIAWAMFRLSSGLHWPLTYTAALGYPIGESISLLDCTPIVGLLLRPFSAILPANFQYLGLYSVLCLILQLFFAVRLVRALLPSMLPSMLPGRQVVVWLGGLFFLIAPNLTLRFTGHYSLASHWVILAALLLYSRIASGAYSFPGAIWRVAALTIVAVGINPYIAAMAVSVLIAACVAAVVTHYMTLRAGAGAVAIIGVCFAVTASALGLIGSTSKDFTAGGYRHYSMNLLAPIDPSLTGSPFMPSQGAFTSGQYEGYNYLGAGTLLLLTLAVFVSLTGRIKIARDDLAKWAPVAVCGALFAVLALSTLVSMGDRVVVDWDPGQHLTPYLAAFRASGRLFWLPYYLITTYAIVSAARLLKPLHGIAILSAVLALQIYDTGPARQFTRRVLSNFAPAEYLTSPVWRTLNREHRHLMVLPAWQCGSDTPGGGDGFQIFGLIAAEQGLTINSYYAARYHQNTLNFHCDTAIEQVFKEGLAADTAYVVSPHVARVISRLVGDDRCYSVDRFILCTVAKIAGEAYWHPVPAPTAPMEVTELTAKDAGYFDSGWTPLEPGFGSWSTLTKAVLVYRTPSGSAKSLRLNLVALAGRNPVMFSVIHESGRIDGVIPVANPPEVRVFTVRLPIGAGLAEHEVTIVNRQLQSPSDQGVNSSDTRQLGIGVHSLAADACPPSTGIDPVCAAAVPVEARKLTAQDSGYFLSGWAPLEPGFGSWSVSTSAVLAYGPPAKPAKSLRLELLALAGKKPVVFTVIHESGRIDGVIPASNPPQVKVFTVRLPIGASPGVHRVTIMTESLRSPLDQGLSSDARPLGIGVHSLAADACLPSPAIDFHSTDKPDPSCVIK